MNCLHVLSFPDEEEKSEMGRWFAFDLLDLFVDEAKRRCITLTEFLPDFLRLKKERKRLIGLTDLSVELSEEEEEHRSIQVSIVGREDLQSTFETFQCQIRLAVNRIEFR